MSNALGLLLLALLVSTAHAQTPPDISASAVGSGTNTPVSITLTGVVGQRISVRGISGFCTAGSAGATLAATAIRFRTNATYFGTSIAGVSLNPPYVADNGVSVTVTLAACGVGGTGTLNVQANRG